MEPIITIGDGCSENGIGSTLAFFGEAVDQNGTERAAGSLKGVTATDEPRTDAAGEGEREMSEDGSGLWSNGDPPSTTETMVDHDRFDDFCRRNYPTIARSLILALNDVDLGREAADEAFALAWQRWEAVSQMVSPAGWVFRVGLNWGRSFLRRTRREVRCSVIEFADRHVDPPDIDPALAEAVAGLSADHRSVLVAKFYLDWSEAEIAAALDIAPGTVKSRLSRALDRLARTPGGSTR